MKRCVLRRESGRVVAWRGELAQMFWTRLRGRRGRAPEEGAALWPRPCAWVHTAGVRAPIDVVMCGRGGTVLRIVRNLRPGRAAGMLRASEICELPAGQPRAYGRATIWISRPIGEARRAVDRARSRMHTVGCDGA